MIAVFFYHKTTWLPWTWLAPTVKWVHLNNNKIILDWNVMNESVLEWWYYLNYNLLDDANYAFTFTPNDDNYIYSVSQSFVRSPWKWWGWFWVSWADVQRYIKSSQSILIEEINKINEQVKKLEEKELPEQEEIDFTPIFDKIDEVKQTKNPEVTTSIGTLKMQITKLSDFLRKEQENEKKEMEKKHQEKMKEKDAEMEIIEKTFEMVSKEYEDKIAEKEQENDSLLEEIEQMLEEINAKTEQEKQAIAEEIKNKILSSL